MAPTQPEIETLLQMGFTPYQIDEAFKKHSTLEAAANYLMDTPIPPSDFDPTQLSPQMVHEDMGMDWNIPEETWVEQRGRTDQTSKLSCGCQPASFELRDNAVQARIQSTWMPPASESSPRRSPPPSRPERLTITDRPADEHDEELQRALQVSLDEVEVPPTYYAPGGPPTEKEASSRWNQRGEDEQIARAMEESMYMSMEREGAQENAARGWDENQNAQDRVRLSMKAYAPPPPLSA
jgi:hypothetical protein